MQKRDWEDERKDEKERESKGMGELRNDRNVSEVTIKSRLLRQKALCIPACGRYFFLWLYDASKQPNFIR